MSAGLIALSTRYAGTPPWRHFHAPVHVIEFAEYEDLGENQECCGRHRGRCSAFSIVFSPKPEAPVAVEGTDEPQQKDSEEEIEGR